MITRERLEQTIAHHDLTALHHAGEPYGILCAETAETCRLALEALDARETIDRLTRERDEPHRFYPGERRTETANSLVSDLERMIGVYNRTETDSQTDYSNVNFYGMVDFDHDLLRTDRATILAGLL